MKKRLIPMYSILAIAIVLLAALAPSCGGGGTKYSLTMAVNPLGSGTATDLTGGSPYASGTVVNIQAAPLGSYQFVKWTSSDGGAFANPNLATTTFTMPAQNVSATANFVGPLDHFKCYNVADASPVGKDVTLTDQFVSINATVTQAVWFANPAQKVHMPPATQIVNPDHHFTFYNITYAGGPQTWYVEVSNQFGNFTLTVSGPHMLAVPTQKVEPGNHRPPLSLDHFLVYRVVNGPLLDVGIGLNDQFGNETSVTVGETFLFANPVQKTVGDVVFPIQHPDEHLVFYKISGTQVPGPTVKVVNQFTPPTGSQSLYLGSSAGLLGVPSQKVDFEEQIDHFKCYTMPPNPEINQFVRLEDQFVDINATVVSASWFCNPAQKMHMPPPMPISDPNHHLTIYSLTGQQQKVWNVQVQNQFGTQDLTVWGPFYLAVPTQKLQPGNHTFPEGLDHYLLYLVMQGTPLEIPVGLVDEFSPEPDSVTVLEPYFFANPVQKTHNTVLTPIENKMAHLVFYKTSTGQVGVPGVQVLNQFLTQPFGYALTGANMLAVPSAKLHFAGPL